VQLRNDYGQVDHTHLPRRRLSSLPCGVVKRVPLLFVERAYGGSVV